MRVVEIASWKRLEKPTRAGAVFTRAPSSFDVAEVIVCGEVRAVSVSCVVRACLSAAASRSRVEAFTFFFSDVTTAYREGAALAARRAS
jgi:hypothetical protein